MKTMKLIFVATTTVLMGLSALAAEVSTPITTSKKWTASKVTGHAAWNTEACLATTPSATTLDSYLEVYSEKAGQIYGEPTIQVIFKQAKQVYSADVNTDKGTKWTFTLASAPVDPSLQAVMARLSDRESIIKALRSDKTLTVKLKDVKGKQIVVMQYSLSGSSGALDAQFKACDLKFQPIP